MKVTFAVDGMTLGIADFGSGEVEIMTLHGVGTLSSGALPISNPVRRYFWVKSLASFNHHLLPGPIAAMLAYERKTGVTFIVTGDANQ